MDSLSKLKVKIFADGADLEGIARLAENPLIRGFTTNPTLMRKAGVRDYRRFALDVLEAVPGYPVSFEVFADEFADMEAQALEIASWGAEVYVKIPITNTRGESAVPLARLLARRGVRVNVTAMFTLDQVRAVTEALADDVSAYVSIFAGRIADTGVDPVPLMAQAVDILKARPRAELIWASPRELLNVFQADSVGCQVITVTHDVLKKLALVDKDLAEFSLDTVRMFHRDALGAGYAIPVKGPAVAV